MMNRCRNGDLGALKVKTILTNMGKRRKLKMNNNKKNILVPSEDKDKIYSVINISVQL